MNTKHYFKTKEEHIALLEGLIERFGDEYIIYLQKIDQGNGISMYSSKMTVGATFTFIKRLPRDYDNPDGLQRALKSSKVSSIKKLASDCAYSQPNAIVLNLSRPQNRLNSIVTIEEMRNTEDILIYKINLNRYMELLCSVEVDDEGYITNEEDLSLGILIDGHHRLQGLFNALRFDFEVPLTVYMDIPKNEIFQIFININKYQEKPSNVHTLAIEQIAGILVNEAEQSLRIIDILNTDMDNATLRLGMDEDSPNQPSWSILFDRIKTVDNKRPPKARKIYINNSTFDKLIKENVFEVVSRDIDVPRKAKILNDYFKAWASCFPEAWNDPKKHVLVKSMGFQIMMKLFPTIYAPLSNGKIPTEKEFRSFIKKTLVNGEMLTIGDALIEISWDSETFGGYSSGKGIGQIVKLLKQHINAQAQVS